MEPVISKHNFKPKLDKIVNITYMSHSSIIYGDNGATKMFKLPWFICINFINEVARNISYPEANTKLQNLQTKKTPIHGSYWVASKDEDVWYPDIVLFYDKPNELLANKTFRLPTWKSVVQYKWIDDNQ